MEEKTAVLTDLEIERTFYPSGGTEDQLLRAVSIGRALERMVLAAAPSIPKHWRTRALQIVRDTTSFSYDTERARQALMLLHILVKRDNTILAKAARNYFSYESADAVFGVHPIRAKQSAEPAALTDAQIREVFMAHGFTIKEGQTDLKPYVYAAARALFSRASSPQNRENSTND